MALWKRRNEVRELVFDHMACVRTALLAFQAACKAYFEEGDVERAAELAAETHRAEGNADDIRRAVEKEMVTGALLPPSRRQILELVERVDSLANAAEGSLDTLLIQRIELPADLVTAVLDILKETAFIWDEVECAIKTLFAGNPTEALNCSDRIEQAEARVDHIERDTLRTLFKMDIDLALKMQIAAFFGDLVEISDRAEDLSDKLALIIAERAY